MDTHPLYTFAPYFSMCSLVLLVLYAKLRVCCIWMHKIHTIIKLCLVTSNRCPREFTENECDYLWSCLFMMNDMYSIHWEKNVFYLNWTWHKPGFDTLTHLFTNTTHLSCLLPVKSLVYFLHQLLVLAFFLVTFVNDENLFCDRILHPMKCWIHLPSTELLIVMRTVGRPTPLQLFLRYEISLRNMSNNNIRSCWK